MKNKFVAVQIELSDKELTMLLGLMQAFAMPDEEGFHGINDPKTAMKLECKLNDALCALQTGNQK